MVLPTLTFVVLTNVATFIFGTWLMMERPPILNCDITTLRKLMEDVHASKRTLTKAEFWYELTIMILECRDKTYEKVSLKKAEKIAKKLMKWRGKMIFDQ